MTLTKQSSAIIEQEAPQAVVIGSFTLYSLESRHPLILAPAFFPCNMAIRLPSLKIARNKVCEYPRTQWHGALVQCQTFYQS
jgi:hypothetical protein